MKKSTISYSKRIYTVFLLGMLFLAAGTADSSADNLYLHSELIISASGTPTPHKTPWRDGVTWTPVSNAGQPFGRAGKGVLGEYFYVFGCLTNPQAQAFNWTTDHWQLSTLPPEGFCNYCGVTTDDAIYLIGWYADFAVGDDVQKFNPTEPPEGEWTEAANYPLAACGIAGAWDGGNYIYTCGGGDIIDIFDQAYRYDIQADQWEPIASLPAPMIYHGGAFINGKFHIVGGITEGSIAHYAYNPSTDYWETKAELPVENHFALCSLTANEDYIFSVGGGGGYYTFPATDAVQVYDPTLDSWSLENPLPAVYGMNSAEVANDGIVISGGGFNGNNYVQYTYRGNGFPGSVSVQDEPPSNLNPADFSLEPPFPNPFNSSTVIRFELRDASFVNLSVYDIAGREVANLADGIQSAGSHSVVFDRADLTSGIYLVQLTVHSGQSMVKKVVLIK